MDVLNATINLTANENITKNGTTSGVQDPQGLVIAYFSLFIMAIVPIYIGAQKSVSRLKDQKKSGDNSVETLTNNDAAMFPLYASAGLFGLYLFFKIFSKEYINMLLSTYFFVLGVLALSNTLNPLIEKYLPDFFPNCLYKLEIKKFSIPPPNEVIESSPEKTVSKSTENINNKSKSKKDKSDKKQSNDNVEVNGELKNLENTNENKTQLFECLLDYPYKRKEFIGLFISAAVGVWYMLTKHWIANNLFGLAFSVSAVELMHLNKVVTGCILLGGLFIYDIFWVFGTNVMVTVAKSFEAPIKLVFPRDLVMSGFSSTNYAMLGLGDIVIPGIFVALLLRFDYSQKKGKQTYFIAGYVAYIIGLMTTMLVMHVFKHAQPALLYLVPACLGIPIILSVILGDQAQLFKYEDNPKVEESKSS